MAGHQYQLSEDLFVVYNKTGPLIRRNPATIIPFINPEILRDPNAILQIEVSSNTHVPTDKYTVSTAARLSTDSLKRSFDVFMFQDLDQRHVSSSTLLDADDSRTILLNSEYINPDKTISSKNKYSAYRFDEHFTGSDIILFPLNPRVKGRRLVELWSAVHVLQNYYPAGDYFQHLVESPAISEMAIASAIALFAEAMARHEVAGRNLYQQFLMPNMLNLGTPARDGTIQEITKLYLAQHMQNEIDRSSAIIVYVVLPEMRQPTAENVQLNGILRAILNTPREYKKHHEEPLQFENDRKEEEEDPKDHEESMNDDSDDDNPVAQVKLPIWQIAQNAQDWRNAVF